MDKAMEERMKVRDRELSNALGGQPRLKAIEKTKAKKRAWLGEMITFARTDEDGSIRTGCKWRVARRKITMHFIQELVNRCPNPCDIDYFYDNNGVAFWMDTLMMDAQPEPAIYYVVPKIIRPLEDVNDDPTYQGQSMLIFQGVPLKTVNGETTVDSTAIREYIMQAITEVDPTITKIQQQIHDIEKEITDIAKKMKKVSQQVFYKTDGTLMPTDESDALREAMYKSYGETKYKTELKLAARKSDLDEHIVKRKKLGMHVFQVAIDQNTETSTWEIQFFGQKDYRQLQDLLLQKTDWSDLKLCCGSSDPPLPPWCGRGRVPNGSKEHIPDYTHLVVNISGARLMRIPHGVGTKKTLKSSTASIAADKFGLYYGDWHLGKKTGYGIDVNDSGIYAGRFVEDRRNGYGRHDLANGTVITGNFGTTSVFPCPIPSEGGEGLFFNPYMDGECNGKDAEILFSGNYELLSIKCYIY
jgi:hypothetical protein